MLPLANRRKPDNDRTLPAAHHQSQGGEAVGGALPDGTPAEPGGTQPKPGIGERVISNTIFRTSGEAIGRLASLLLFAETGRSVGQSGLGAFVFAVAYLGFAMVAVDLGLDRWLLRAIARDRAATDHPFFDVLALKLAIAAPLFALAIASLHIASYNHLAQATTWALAPGVLADSIARSQLAVFVAHERGGPPAFADALQRVLSAALGIAALKLGYGVVAVALMYSTGSAIGVVIGFILLARTVGISARRVKPVDWRTLAARSIPFATQDLFTVLLARMDTLLLSLLATQAIVGRYGAAYRLFESTLIVTYALGGAFAAMYTYLGHRTTPSLSFVFQRSIKLALASLVPVAVVLAVLARPICRLIYGAGFGSSAAPLRILAPAVVLLGVVTLCTSLMVSRENPRRMVWMTAAIVLVNLLLNLLLIPPWKATGAAAAMLASEVVFAVWIMHSAHRAVGSLQWRPMLAGALAAGVGMALTMQLLLAVNAALALAGGAIAYLLILLAIERVVAPGDVELVVQMVRRRLAPRQAQ